MCTNKDRKHVGQNVGIYVSFDRFDGFDDPQKTEKNHKADRGLISFINHPNDDTIRDGSSLNEQKNEYTNRNKIRIKNNEKLRTINMNTS